jgi:AcrR family transcriptional regulator
MAKTAPPAHRLADALLRQAAKKSWNEIALLDVARAARVPVGDLQTLAPDKLALIPLVLQRLGEQVAKQYRPQDLESAVRERLFDVAMAWFDTIAPHKVAMRSLYLGLRDPFSLLALRRTFQDAAAWLLTLARADDSRFVGLRAAGLALVMGRAIPVWLEDDGDLAKTMAQIDGDLSRAALLLDRVKQSD